MRKASFTNIIELAQFCAELTRQGITFDCDQRGAEFVVVLKGF